MSEQSAGFLVGVVAGILIAAMIVGVTEFDQRGVKIMCSEAGYEKVLQEESLFWCFDAENGKTILLNPKPAEQWKATP